MTMTMTMTMITDLLNINVAMRPIMEAKKTLENILTYS